MDDIRVKEDELFSRWRKERGYQYFVKDGVFCPEQWLKETLKITFVMKEANWRGEDADMREWVLGETSATYWKTWNNIARWTKAILEGGEYPRYVSKKSKTYWLGRASFINLKKVGGGSAADNGEIREYAINDARYILEQLNLYKPDIIICCGRGNGKNADLLYENILPEESLTVWQPPIKGYNYFYTKFPEKENKTPVLSFYHPQRIARHETFEKWYSDMVEISQIILSPGL
ncbi:MAG: hypothetical protein FWF44_06440 [Defluviitaleaceae bacterium]|nr:hypothetical protein [Defluviitaleaceae bacterium]